MWRRIAVLGAVAAGALLLLRYGVVERIQPTRSNERMEMELLRAAARADLCTAANAPGVGLRGEYFTGPDMRGTPALTRIDETVDFVQLASGASTPSVASVRWSGWIKAPLTGAYRFHANAPNMRINVANTLVAGADAAPEQKFDMAAGRFYPIEITVTDIANPDLPIKLEWTAPHGARYVVPKALLYLPTEMVTAPKK